MADWLFLALVFLQFEAGIGDNNITLPVCDTCDCYQIFSMEHTFCNSVDLDACGPNTKSCMLEEDKQMVVDLHNKYRSRIATGQATRYHRQPPAANMMNMYWDEDMAKVAQKLADICDYNHDCSACREDPRFTVGQNICFVPQNGSAKWKLCMALWFDEIKLFKNSWIKPFFDGETGHFTQMNWASTWKIGCGCRNYKDGQLLICNYGPSGNIIQGEMYKEGPACSQCPRSTKCINLSGNSSKEEKYPGLCEPNDVYGPQIPLPDLDERVLLWCNFSDETAEDCKFSLDPGSVQWTTERTFNHIYKAVRLNQGETTVLRLNKVLRILHDRVKFKLNFRKSPEKADEEGNQPFTVHVEVSKYPDYGTSVKINEDRTEWTPFKTSVNSWPVIAQLSVEFTNNLPNPQTLQISDILIARF